MEQLSSGTLIDLLLNKQQEHEQEKIIFNQDPKVLLEPENRKVIENFYWHMILAEKRDRVSEQRIILHDCAGFKVLNSLREGNISENSMSNIIAQSKINKRIKLSGAKLLSTSLAKHFSKYMLIDEKKAHKYRGGIVYMPGEKFNEIYNTLSELLLLNNKNLKIVRNYDFLKLIDYNERKFCDLALAKDPVSRNYLANQGVSDIEKLIINYSGNKMIKSIKSENYIATDKGQKYLALHRKLEFNLIHARKVGEEKYQRKQFLDRYYSGY